MAARTRASRRPRHTRVAASTQPTSPGLDLLDMDQAIAMLKTSRPTFYRWLRAGKLKGLKVGRQWRFEREAVERFLKGEEPRIELPVAIGPFVQDLREQCVKAGGPQGVPAGNDVAAAVELMILLAHRAGASDIHLEPVLTASGGIKSAHIRLRVDGSLRIVAETDIRLLPALVERWKVLAGCNVQEKARPQNGLVYLDIGEAAGAQRIEADVCFIPTDQGESLTGRLFPTSSWVLPFEKMDFSPEVRARIARALELPYGLLVFSGPTGSGKTTVLLCCLNHLVRPEHKVFTIEDPIAIHLPGVQQIRVQPALGLDFPAALKAVMRSDPDIIAVGEVRDAGTLRLTLDAALSGHLVMTQVHADEAVKVLPQLIAIGGDPFLVSEAAKFVACQRLVRKLCKECSVERAPSPELLAKAQELARAGGLAWDKLPHPQQFREPVGCAKCNGGFRGRTAIAETLEVTPVITAALRKGATLEELRAMAISQGMTTMVTDGIRKAAQGVTPLLEVLRVCGQISL